jgi:DNA-binding IscR family transcriptional regulator
MLAQDPGEVSLLDIIEAIEGPIQLNYCQHNPSQCDEESCPIRPLWKELQETIRSKLSAMKLSDCLDNSSRTPGADIEDPSDAVTSQGHD